MTRSSSKQGRVVPARRSKSAEVSRTVKLADKRSSEHEVASKVRDVLAGIFSPKYEVHQGKSILYRIEIDPSGKATHNSSAPRRGKYAFQTDILIAKGETPLVVIELKYGSFSSHDVITYSWKAERHKQVYPYLRYGFVVVGVDILGRRFLTHNEGFDFAAALPDVAQTATQLVPVVRRQIASAERMIELLRHSRVKLRRFEQNVDIGL